VSGDTLSFALDDVQQVGIVRSDALANTSVALAAVLAAAAVAVGVWILIVLSEQEN
jgi:hypothetical protein